MPFKDIKIEEIFDENSAFDYSTRFDALWQNLFQAHTSLKMVEEIIDFPANLLLDDDRQLFFNMVIKNFVEKCALIVINVAYDADESSLTFETLIRLIKEKMSYEKQVEFEVELRDIENMIINLKKCEDLGNAWKLRNKLLAHQDIAHAIDTEKRRQILLDIKAFRMLLDKTEEIFDSLCIGGGKSLLPMQYMKQVSHPPGYDTRTDVQCLLDLLAANSAVLRMPEEHDEVWPIRAASLTDEEKETFNGWRERIGKERVDFDAIVAII